jgi:hypothetical protein
VLKAASVVLWPLCAVLVFAQPGATQTASPQNKLEVQRDCTADNAPLPPPLGNRPHVTINLKTTEMMFGQANKVPVDLHGQALREISVSWDSLWGPLSPVAVEHDVDGGSFVEVTPKGIGKLVLALGFVYEDCAIQEERVDVSVRAPERAPERLVLTWTNWHDVRKEGTAQLDFADFSSVVLTPIAYYKGVDSAVPILGDEVAFTVLTRKNEEAPVTFDPSFRAVHSAHVGQALIKATFRRISAYTCVDVKRDVKAASGASGCHDILPNDAAAAIKNP